TAASPTACCRAAPPPCSRSRPLADHDLHRNNAALTRTSGDVVDVVVRPGAMAGGYGFGQHTEHLAVPGTPAATVRRSTHRGRCCCGSLTPTPRRELRCAGRGAALEQVGELALLSARQ